MFHIHTKNTNMGVKHGSELAGTLGSIIEMDVSPRGSSKGLDNANKSHPSCSSKGFVEKENSVEINWKQLSIDFDPRDFSKFEMETYFLELD